MKQPRKRHFIEKDNYHDYIFSQCAYRLETIEALSDKEDVKEITHALYMCSDIIFKTEHKVIESYNNLLGAPANKRGTPVYDALEEFIDDLRRNNEINDRRKYKETVKLIRPSRRERRELIIAKQTYPRERAEYAFPFRSEDKGLVNSFKMYYRIISALVTDINNMRGWKRINRYFRDRVKPSSIESIQQPLTFLSFAFKDNIYALFLYNYFEEQGGFLYVDSLFGKDYGDDGAAIKGALSPWIDASSQILFLHSINSDKVTKGLSSWCSWELGEAYRSNTSDAPKKFYKVVVAGITDSHAIIDDTFKELDHVTNGIIIPKVYYK